MIRKSQNDEEEELLLLASLENERRTSRRQNRKNIQRIVDDFDNWADAELTEYNSSESNKTLQDRAKQYTMLLAPYVVTQYNRQSIGSINDRIMVNDKISNVLNDYNGFFESLLLASAMTINNTSVDSDLYNKAREDGASTVEALHISDSSNVTDYNVLSEKQLERSLMNREAQIEATANHDFYTSLVDSNGEQLAVQKMWIWSTLENTRHSLMDGEVVGIDEYFDVYNEQADYSEQGLYPRDPSMSDGNIMNCMCSCDYLDEFGNVIDPSVTMRNYQPTNISTNDLLDDIDLSL